MKIAVISDIHSNVYALRAVLEDLKAAEVNDVLVLGDLFGYYPWAVKTYECLQTINLACCIKGNHDVIVEAPPEVHLSNSIYVKLALHNRSELLNHCPDSIQWLKNLKLSQQIEIGGRSILLCHGTPSNPLDGRFYPDHANKESWFPTNGEIIMLGHTHHPLLKSFNNGIIFNPGSVGQPREGDPRASYGLVNLTTMRFEHKKVPYDVEKAANELRKMDWEPYAIKALLKDYSGPLR